MHLLKGHTDQITSHQFDANTLASASLSGHIRIWDLRQGGGGASNGGGGRCVHLLNNGSAVHAFQFDGNRLVRIVLRVKGLAGEDTISSSCVSLAFSAYEALSQFDPSPPG